MSEDSHKCVFCKETFNINEDTHAQKSLYFGPNCGGKVQFMPYSTINVAENAPVRLKHSNLISIEFFYCPGCGQTQILVRGLGKNFGESINTIMSYPISSHKQYSKNIVPHNVIEDYEEACSIVSLSPKSSVTLSRRIIEEVIEDFYGISKGTLFNKIKTLESKNEAIHITNELNAIRQVGNIGAHFNLDANKIPNDVSTEEANLLLQVVEDIIDETYIRKHDVETRKISVQKLADKFKNKK